MGHLHYTWIKARSQRPRKQGTTIQSIILHSTDGRKAGDISVLTRGKVSVHWYITRAGDIYHFVEHSNCAYHAGAVADPMNNNDHTIGIELEHFDGNEDWPAIQVQMVANLVAFIRQQYRQLPIKTHASIAYPPGRKVDPVGFPWNLLSRLYKAASREAWIAVAV